VQVLLNVLRGMTPQAALDAPRFCISAGLPDADTEDAANAGNIDSEVWMEEGISDEVVQKLRGKPIGPVLFNTYFRNRYGPRRKKG
jgi:gamma-glutamyltranspeptidase/glutathione hydrolase